MRRSCHAATLFQYLKNLREAAVMTEVPLRIWCQWLGDAILISAIGIYIFCTSYKCSNCQHNGMLRGHIILGLQNLLAAICNGKLKYSWALAETCAAVFAASVDGVDHRWCFQFTDALLFAAWFSNTTTAQKAMPPRSMGLMRGFGLWGDGVIVKENSKRKLKWCTWEGYM